MRPQCADRSSIGKLRLVIPSTLFGEALSEYADSLYSPDSLCAYPKLLGIPCLRPEDAIIASACEEFMPLERAAVA